MLRPNVQALYCHVHLQQLVVGFDVQLRLLNNELASDLIFLMKAQNPPPQNQTVPGASAPRQRTQGLY